MSNNTSEHYSQATNQPAHFSIHRLLHSQKTKIEVHNIFKLSIKNKKTKFTLSTSDNQQRKQI